MGIILPREQTTMMLCDFVIRIWPKAELVFSSRGKNKYHILYPFTLEDKSICYSKVSQHVRCGSTLFANVPFINKFLIVLFQVSGT